MLLVFCRWPEIALLHKLTRQVATEMLLGEPLDCLHILFLIEDGPRRHELLCAANLTVEHFHGAVVVAAHPAFLAAASRAKRFWHLSHSLNLRSSSTAASTSAVTGLAYIRASSGSRIL